MLVDACIFFNEVQLLDLRMRELYAVVDKFVVIEAGQTFSGKPKPSYISMFRDRLYDPKDKLVYVFLPELPPLQDDTEVNRFRLEAFHRNAIMLGLQECELEKSDLVIISDVDEIPSKESIVYFQENAVLNKIFQFSQLFLKFYFNEELNDGYNGRWWGGSVGTTYSQLSISSPQEMRRGVGCGGQLTNPILAQQRGVDIIHAGGWHLSSFGGSQLKEYKLGHYAHGIGRVKIEDTNQNLAMLPTRFDLDPMKTMKLLEICAETEEKREVKLPDSVKADVKRYVNFFMLP